MQVGRTDASCMELVVPLRYTGESPHQFCVRVLEMAADLLKRGDDATLGWGALAASLKATSRGTLLAANNPEGVVLSLREDGAQSLEEAQCEHVESMVITHVLTKGRDPGWRK